MFHENSFVKITDYGFSLEAKLMKELRPGDKLICYDPETLKPRNKPVAVKSTLKVTTLTKELHTSTMDSIYIAIDSIFLSTNGRWCMRDTSNYATFKLLKTGQGKPIKFTPTVRQVLPKGLGVFVDIRTEEDAWICVNNYIVFCKGLNSDG